MRIDSYWQSRALALAILLAAVPFAAASTAGVEVVAGATPIPGGDAQLDGDLTLRNEHLAVSIAVDTAPAYGVPAGSIIDAAPVVDGEIAGAGDTLTLVDLIPNNWSAWPNTYSNVEVLADSGDRGAVRVERDWGDVVMTTTYELERGSDQVHMVTEMRNDGAQAQEDLLSGYVLWERSGYFFGIPGLVARPGSGEQIPESGTAEDAFASYNALYGKNWAFAIHFPDYDHYDYSGRDLYVQHTLKAGQTRTFEGWFQVVPSGDLSELLAAENRRAGNAVGTIAGEIETGAGEAVAEPAVIALKDGRPYTWTLGKDSRYELALPEGEYTLYATARAHSKSGDAQVRVRPNAEMQQDFSGLRAPGELRLAIRDQHGPTDARIRVAEGTTPLIRFLGRSTFFTEAKDIGAARLVIAPGDYRFEVNAGAGFVSKAVTTDTVTVPSGERTSRDLQVSMTARPNREGWYAADLHHHGLGAEGVTPPEYVFRSELAAQLDVAFLSDHDTMEYLPEMAALAKARDVPFIPSIEISPSWGHFNPYPVEIGRELSISPGTATIDEVFAEARDLGASVIQANHPTNPYGYFTNLEHDAVPGGFNPGFDLIEMNACCYEETWEKAQTYWNRYLAGELDKYYALSAGSDVHDVWTEMSGKIRLYAHLEGEPSAEGFVAAAKAGHAYATLGPLIYPQTAAGENAPALFGNRYTIGAEGTFDFAVDLQAVHGLQSVTLMSEGEAVETRDLSGHGNRATDIAFSVHPDHSSWYALVVQDGNDNKAYTNPIWLAVR